jgi:hypothetical protein
MDEGPYRPPDRWTQGVRCPDRGKSLVDVHVLVVKPGGQPRSHPGGMSLNAEVLQAAVIRFPQSMNLLVDRCRQTVAGERCDRSQARTASFRSEKRSWPWLATRKATARDCSSLLASDKA